MNIIPITNINQAKAPNHTFLPSIAAATQEQALEELAAKYPHFNTSGGFAYWLETERGGSLWCPADWKRTMP